ncbi:aldo/keto reductase family protein [Criblamydia sequanensis]|uniref:Oxidoreductase n=1 Tax=Candidatus Criblamydia sequanensis CRIB-18 TaxID=1437425 RepID=A0A090E2M7_9BACT|nr:aldo/keto reductase [Criblamydia sequanensis]CDR34899.1 Oxidoreductase [Criblamydia sequanensis CRIB-18]
MENRDTKVAMPHLIYGTAWKKEKTADLVTKAIQYGFRGIDTACQPKHYNEKGVGDALKKLEESGFSRKSLYIQTKFTPLNGQDPNNIPYDFKAPLKSQVHQSFEVSRKNLGVSYLNGWILHSPLNKREETLAVWKAMEEIHNQGGVQRLGISNCYDLDILKELYEASQVKPTILQNRFYRETGYDKEIRAWCEKKEITYQSFWTLTANPEILNSETVQKAAFEYQKTPAQIFFRFLIAIGIVPLTGTTSDKHMQEDLEIFNFELQRNTIGEIASLFD